MRHEKVKGNMQNTLIGNGGSVGELNNFCKVNDSLAFYKRMFKSEKPSIIDLIGAAGTGKTTFCQQFVDGRGKKY